MPRCDECCTKALRYLDDDLERQELARFRIHLEASADCRTALEAEQEMSSLLHRTRPLYAAPFALRARVSTRIMQYSAPKLAGTDIFLSVLHELQRILAYPVRRLTSVRVLALLVILLGFLFAFTPSVIHQVRAASYVEAAVSVHRSYLDGQRVIALRSNSPEIVTAWFTKQVPFHFRLPNPQSSPNDTPAYRLTGASIVDYRGTPIALVVYEKQNQAITLLVASSNYATVAGGDEVRFGNLTFHYKRQSGLKVITWSNHGLSYALVSNVPGSAQESCLVCHQNMTDHHNFRAGQ